MCLEAGRNGVFAVEGGEDAVDFEGLVRLVASFLQQHSSHEHSVSIAISTFRNLSCSCNVHIAEQLLESQMAEWAAYGLGHDPQSSKLAEDAAIGTMNVLRFERLVNGETNHFAWTDDALDGLARMLVLVLDHHRSSPSALDSALSICTSMVHSSSQGELCCVVPMVHLSAGHRFGSVVQFLTNFHCTKIDSRKKFADAALAMSRSSE
jgi:hypothetical protein